MPAPDQLSMHPRPLSARAWQAGRTFSDLHISPSGDKISYVCRIGSAKELLIREVQGADAVLALDPPIGSGGHSWLPGDAGLVYAATDDRLYRFDLDTSATRVLTSAGEKASAPEVSPDGSEVVYIVDDLKAIAIASSSGAGHRRIVADGADFVIDPVWSPDGGVIAWVEWDVPNMAWDASRLIVRDSRCENASRLVAGGNDVSVQQPRFSPDGQTLAFLSDETGWLNLWSVDATSLQNAKAIVEETFEHGVPTWSSRQRSYAWVENSHIAFTRNEHGWSRLATCHVDTGEVTELDDGATAIAGGSGKILLTTVGPRVPVSLALYELDSRRKHVVSYATPMGVARHGHEPELISWRASDGAEIHGRFYSAGDHAPLLVYTHGGPTSQSPATLHARFDYFLERGWSVFVPDHRGTTGWGRAYQQSMRGRWGELDVSDVASGTAHVIEQGLCNPATVVAIGGSAGGFTTLLLLAKHPELFAAGVVQYPVCDLVDLAWTTWRFEAHYLDTMIGELPGAHGDYVLRSPLAHALQITAPLLVLQGDNDEVVDIGQVREMVAAVKRNGTLVEMHVYEGEGHGWRRAETRADELERVEEFLRKHVLHVGPTREGRS